MPRQLPGVALIELNNVVDDVVQIRQAVNKVLGHADNLSVIQQRAVLEKIDSIAARLERIRKLIEGVG